MIGREGRIHLELIERFLANLEVGVGAFTSCDVRKGFRLTFEACTTATVHYCLAGRGAIRLKDGRVFQMKQHSFILLPPGVLYSIEANAKSSGHETPLRRLRAPLFKESVPTLQAGHGNPGILTACGEVRIASTAIPGLLSGFDQPIMEHFDEPDRLRDQFVILLAESVHPRLGGRALTEALLKQCFVLLLRRQMERGRVPLPWMAALSDPGLARALQALLERPAERFTVQRLAAIAGMSRSKFALHFAETLGQTPMNLLREIRLQKAREMLATTNLPIAEVAHKTGFSSRSNFSSLFRKTYGMDPSRFRKKTFA